MVAIVPAQRNATVQATGSTAKTHDFICSERTNQGVFREGDSFEGACLGSVHFHFCRTNECFSAARLLAFI